MKFCAKNIKNLTKNLLFNFFLYIDLQDIIKYIEKFHKNEVQQIVTAVNIDDIPFRGLKVDLTKLCEESPNLFKNVNKRIHEPCFAVYDEKPKWSKALTVAQESLVSNAQFSERYVSVKKNFPVNFVNLPGKLATTQLIDRQLWFLCQIKGHIYRTSERSKKEAIRKFQCKQCKVKVEVKANRFHNFLFKIPEKCADRICKGAMHEIDQVDELNETDFDNYIDFQVCFLCFFGILGNVQKNRAQVCFFNLHSMSFLNVSCNSEISLL